MSVRKENISREGVPMFSCFRVDTQGEFDKCAWRLGSQDVLVTRALSFVKEMEPNGGAGRDGTEGCKQFDRKKNRCGGSRQRTQRGLEIVFPSIEEARATFCGDV